MLDGNREADPREERPMKWTRKPKGKVMILVCSGKLMGGPDYEKFHGEIKSLVAEGFKNVLLDFEKITFINSTGVGILISGFTTLKTNGGHLKICKLTDRVESIFIVSQLDRVFELFWDCEQALGSFGES
jgi:anti-sigma B factor antagonist